MYVSNTDVAFFFTVRVLSVKCYCEVVAVPWATVVLFNVGLRAVEEGRVAVSKPW